MNDAAADRASTITLTQHQVRELAKLAESAGEPREFRLQPFSRDLPGMVSVDDERGDWLLLYPEPKPVPRDPLFQHAKAMDGLRFAVCMVQLDRAHMHNGREAAAYCIDAPDRMPAGACEFFDFGSDTYGAMQLEIWRDEF